MGPRGEPASNSDLHLFRERFRDPPVPEEDQTGAPVVHAAKHHEQKVDQLEILNQLEGHAGEQVWRHGKLQSKRDQQSKQTAK